MADDVDTANERAELARAAAATLRKPAGPVATGRCLNCNALLPPGMRWCDALCRDEEQKDNS